MSKNKKNTSSHKTSKTSRTTSRRSNKPRGSKVSFVKYLPAVLISLFASYLYIQPYLQASRLNKNDVLAYSTHVSIDGLLTSTNQQRAANGVASLGLNSALNTAAQAKANDMVSRNYWSHQTPDGQQPWIFINNTGYKYLSAGENLAYGFMTSNATVTGWMNSPTHKSNMLSSNFTEVGFGIANSPNYVNNGQQTVIVAMYAKPQVLASSQTNVKASEPAPVKRQEVNSSASPATPPKSTQKQEETASLPVENDTSDQQAADSSEPHKEDTVIAASDMQGDPPLSVGTAEIKRIDIMAGGNSFISATLIILSVCAVGLLWLLHRSIRFKKWLKSSEKLVGKYLYLDLTVLAIVYLGFVLLTFSGAIK